MIDSVGRIARVIFVVALVVVGGSCSEGPAEPPDGAALISVLPEGGEAGVDTVGPVSVSFDAPLLEGMEAGVALHRGDVAGPTVEGVWSFSHERTTLVFTPEGPLEADERYTVHVRAGMRDREAAPWTTARTALTWGENGWVLGSAPCTGTGTTAEDGTGGPGRTAARDLTRLDPTGHGAS